MNRTSLNEQGESGMAISLKAVDCYKNLSDVRFKNIK